jgi:predicted phosphodiesterase
MKEIRPRLTDDWFALIDQVKEIGVEEALRRIEAFHAGRIVFDSKTNTATVNSNRILTAEQLMEACNVDQDEWVIENKVLNKWEVGAKGPDGNIVVEPLYQVKIWLKRRGFQAPDNHWTKKWMDRLTKDTYQPPRVYPQDNTRPINVVIADVHLGRFTNESYGEYNVEVVRERLSRIAAVVNYTARPVNIFMLGDLIESFTGKNKPNTWKQIEMHGAKLALTAYDILEDFFSSIDQLDKVIFVGGNHDRITDSKDDDDGGQVLEIVHGIFARKGRFWTVFDPTMQSVKIDGVNYILTHGDKKISKLPGSELVLRYGDSKTFNCILSGHLHTRQIVEEGTSFTKRIVPPIASSSEYEYHSGWTSNPGFLIIESHENRVKITDYPL